MSALWKRLHLKAEGSLPGNLITQWGVGITALLILGFLTAYIFFGRENPATEAETGDAAGGPQSPRDFAAQMAARIEAEGLREQQRQSAAVRDVQRRQAAEAIAGGRVSTGGSPPPAGEINATTGAAYTEDEWRLRETLRLEEMERRSRSLRSAPVAHTYRGADGGAPDQNPDPESQELASAAQSGGPDSTLEQLQRTFENATAGMVAEADAAVAAEVARLQAEAGAALPANVLPGALPTALPTVAPAAPPAPPRDYSDPPRIGAVEDPPGWERIHEGTFLEAVLMTQLSGDFPGPVLATVSVPFYSADRQRILIPRGSRIIGTTQAVTNQDQERLAVGFHRLILPDGRWVSLGFHGLNQLGEGALKDQVNRHYFSMFAAVGAVGVLSGLTLRGSDPYGGARESFQAGAGQGLGQAAMRILDRFLNRLPTITIRAGHRLRVWFTSDVLVPRPQRKGD